MIIDVFPQLYFNFWTGSLIPPIHTWHVLNKLMKCKDPLHLNNVSYIRVCVWHFCSNHVLKDSSFRIVTTMLSSLHFHSV